jgi:hypothetical protein
MPLRCRTVSAPLFAAALALSACAARAQGGPPMLTDDPGTPGDGKWEINIAALSDHEGDTTTFQLPQLDLNYGVGDRIQLNFQLPWLLQHERGQPDLSGLGNSLVGVKWRFFDAGEDGWQISTYPHVQSRFPAARAALSEPGVSYLLPLEFARKFGDWGVNLEAGRWLRPSAQDDTWIAGLAVGRELRKGLEFIAELHDERAVHASAHELAVNLGMRWEWSERYTLLAALGADVHNGLGPRDAPLTYLGLQINL